MLVIGGTSERFGYVCSDKCYTKLKELVDNRTWMDHRPPAMFGNKKSEKPSPNFGPSALTDKQFGVTE